MSITNINSPLKVVWICHVSNHEIDSHLFRIPQAVSHESQPWISNTIEVFQNSPNLKLYIVSPHHGLAPLCQTFEMRGVTYNFFRPFVRFCNDLKVNWFTKKLRTLINLGFPINYWFDYPINSYRISKIIKRIKPDVIHLQGAECAFYSSSILRLKSEYPIVTTIAGFISHTHDMISPVVKHQIKIEQRILSEFNVFGIRTKQMAKDVLYINNTAKLFWLNYRIKELSPIRAQKEYDIVFFARVCKDKGIEDTIKALELVNHKREKTNLLVIGLAGQDYLTYLESLAESLSVHMLITWSGFLPSQTEVHRMASKAKVSVLPTYHDTIPGTIIESMQLGLPVVSYKAGSIPELNEERENVLLSDIGDIEGVADNILRLLTDEELYKTMSQRGIECIRERYSNQNVLQQHLDCYREVIADFQNSKIKKQVTESSLRNGYTD